MVQSSVPLILLAIFLIAPSYIPSSNLALQFSSRTLDAYSFRDLTDLLPEGLQRITAAASWGSGAVIVGQSSYGEPVLAEYDASQDALSSPLKFMPSHYTPPDAISRAGSLYLLSGRSVGTSPVLGLYDSSTSEFVDVTDVLPWDVGQIVTIIGGTGSFLLVLDNETDYRPALFSTNSRTLIPLNASWLENIAQVSGGAWDGSAFFLAGQGVSGDPALIALDPSQGSFLDLSETLPEDMERVDHLIWSQDALFILGARSLFWETKASMAVYNRSSGEMTSLTDSLRWDYSEVLMGTWNGSALILMVRGGGPETLMAYFPDNGTSLYVDGVIPTYWEYSAMIGYGEDAILLGDRGRPAAGFLETSSWYWEEREKIFEGAIKVILDVEAADGSFVLAGSRSKSAALGFLNVDNNSLDDMSNDLDVRDAAIFGVSWSGEDYLLAGSNDSSGLLYRLDPESSSLQDLTTGLPDGLDYLYDPAWNGNVYLIPGNREGKPSLLVHNPSDGMTEEVNREVQLYFNQIIRVVAYGDRFLLMGSNSQGAALATFDVEAKEIDYLGNELGELYGTDGVLTGAAWNGELLAVGGGTTSKPILGLWVPAQGIFTDHSAELPGEFGMIHHVLWTGKEFMVGGFGPRGASLGAYYVSNGTFADLSRLLPPSHSLVYGMASLEGEVLVVSAADSSNPSIGVLSLARTSDLFGNLPSILGDPVNAAILGISVALVALFAYQQGRRRRRSASPPLPTQHYPHAPFEAPGDYPEVYEEYPSGDFREDEIQL